MAGNKNSGIGSGGKRIGAGRKSKGFLISLIAFLLLKSDSSIEKVIVR